MDIRLSYTEAGRGTPLVMLHGNNESSAYFENQFEEFAGYYRVIAVDTRGHGKSPRGDAPFTLVQFAEDLKCLLDGLKIGKCNLLGFSDGGNIALLFALKYPQYVEKLILNGANLYPGGMKTAELIHTCFDYAVACVKSVFDRRAVASREMLALMVNQPHIKPDELKTLCVPTLVIVGKDDMIKDRHSRLIAELLPAGVFRCITGDHFIAAGNSAEFNREVLCFLSGRPE